jgi:LmbE family N-acetylglucosaminyl deacetylase
VKRFFLLFIFCLPICLKTFAGNIEPLADFTARDKVLVMAAHPDDEIIATGGVIQRAKAVGASVKVVLYTNGDSNELAFIAYEKRLIFKKKAFLYMGNIRHEESVRACSLLGLKEDDIYTLGYPDFGTMEIFTKYWGKNIKPLRSMLPRVTNVSYSQALSPNAPFVGESILKDIKTIIREYKPTKIFVSHPVDTNRDHRALYLFTRIAVWDLVDEGILPKVYPYLIHVVGWPTPRGYHSNLELKPFYKLSKSDIVWRQLLLTDAEIEKKHSAILLFPSQNQPTSRYLTTFARKNELFGDYPDIALKRQEQKDFIWQNIGTIDRYTRTSFLKPREKVSALSYAWVGSSLYVRMITKVPLAKNFGVLAYLFGYKSGVDFATMPKIALMVSANGLRVKNGRQTLFIKSIDFQYKGNQLIFKVPLKVLGNPNRVLACPKIAMGNLPLDKIAWRILRLE